MKGKGGLKNDGCPYKGVRQQVWGKWVAEICEPKCGGARIWLGTCNAACEAAMAYDNAAKKLYGSDAQLNIPRVSVRWAPDTDMVMIPPPPSHFPPPPSPQMPIYTIVMVEPLGPEIPRMPEDYMRTMENQLERLHENDDFDMWDVATAGTTFNGELIRSGGKI